MNRLKSFIVHKLGGYFIEELNSTEVVNSDKFTPVHVKTSMKLVASTSPTDVKKLLVTRLVSAMKDAEYIRFTEKPSEELGRSYYSAEVLLVPQEETSKYYSE